MDKSVSRTDDYSGDNLNAEVIFSFLDGYVWASWPGAVSTVRLGRYDSVMAAMSDFQAQSELGERLANSAAWIRSGG